MTALTLLPHLFLHCSLYQTLSCTNCCHVLGKFYCSTPAHLNYKMNLYNIDNSVVYRYTLGEDFQQVIPSSQAPVTLEICQCYEEEIEKQKVLLEMSLDRLSKLEKEVLPPPEQDF
ncbi:hypothetical protein GDO78_021028 [Eleutherodactylus coqui]|uniref:Protein yippee-like n=1 Tax=Eleutherodactylus coqui TaxID=57060 RepID=A0A8J6E8H3_ELECQ|nr:hypothetical protein GDO78_021028 [Eleutherodactylus coqui]